jgi:predicted metal-dependent phosphotriesterase family hydrolase
MKKFIYSVSAAIAILAVGVATVFTTGCKTVPPGTIAFDLNKAAVDLQIVTDVGVYYYLQKHPEAKPTVTAIADAVSVLVKSGNADVNALAASVIKATGANNDLKVAITAALGLYQSNFGDAVAAGLQQNQVATALLTAFENGLRQALSQTSPSLQYRRR